MEKKSKLGSLLSKKKEEETPKRKNTSCVIKFQTLDILHSIKSEVEYQTQKSTGKRFIYTNQEILHDAMVAFAKSKNIKVSDDE